MENAAEAVDSVPVQEAEEPVRLLTPDRSQLFLDPTCLDDRLPDDHRARVVWEVVKRLDLSRFEAGFKARGSTPGRPAIDPRILLALWLTATLEGIGSARRVARLCERDDAYRWICGGVGVNYHTLSDFRVSHEKALDELLSELVATLVKKGLVRVDRIAQDGTRVRASAGPSSFRRGRTLQALMTEAKRHIEQLKKQAGPEVAVREKAARERAARERAERIEEAAKQVEAIHSAKEKQKNKPSKRTEARASTTDPDARVMKMPDGGYRPAYNVQLAKAGGAIVGVEVTNQGSDVKQSTPMRKQVESRTQEKVKEHVMDGGYVGLASVEEAAAEGVDVYAPPPEPRKGGDPYQPKKGDSEAIAQWRQRMGTEPAKEIYKGRLGIERVNGDVKEHRGFRAVNVRGLAKVRSVSLMVAVAFNILYFSEALLR